MATSGVNDFKNCIKFSHTGFFKKWRKRYSREVEKLKEPSCVGVIQRQFNRNGCIRVDPVKAVTQLAKRLPLISTDIREVIQPIPVYAYNETALLQTVQADKVINSLNKVHDRKYIKIIACVFVQWSSYLLYLQ